MVKVCFSENVISIFCTIFAFHCLANFLLLSLGASINYVDKQGEGGGHPNVNSTTKDYVVTLSTKGVKNSQNVVNVVYECPLDESSHWKYDWHFYLHCRILKLIMYIVLKAVSSKSSPIKWVNLWSFPVNDLFSSFFDARLVYACCHQQTYFYLEV